MQVQGTDHAASPQQFVNPGLQSAIPLAATAVPQSQVVFPSHAEVPSFSWLQQDPAYQMTGPPQQVMMAPQQQSQIPIFQTFIPPPPPPPSAINIDGRLPMFH